MRHDAHTTHSTRTSGPNLTFSLSDGMLCFVVYLLYFLDNKNATNPSSHIHPRLRISLFPEHFPFSDVTCITYSCNFFFQVTSQCFVFYFLMFLPYPFLDELHLCVFV